MTLHLEALGVTHGPTVALADVDLVVPTDSTLAVLGASGSGKTTLLRAIAGLDAASGRVRWDDEDLSRIAPHRRGIGMVFQDHALLPHRDVLGNVRFGLEGRGADRTTATARARSLLASVGLEGYDARTVNSLSGGEAQRVALARALAPSPRVLLLDEPYGALDRERRDRLMLEVRAILRDAGVTVVHVTHDHEEAFALGDAVAILHEGRLEQVGPPDAVWSRPASTRVARFLGATTAIEGEAHDGTITTPLGPIRAAGPGPGPVTVSWRPEAAHLDAAGAIEGRVTDATFRRTHHLVAVATAAGSIEAVADRAPTLGEPVRVTLDADAVFVHPR